jgi:hypothetical protein
MQRSVVIANRTWNNFRWPAWVPVDVRRQVAYFYSEAFGLGPADWLAQAVKNRTPLFGAKVRMRDLRGGVVEGRFVYAWNNVGRVVADNGRTAYVAIDAFEVSRDGAWQEPRPSDYATNENSIDCGLQSLSAKSDDNDRCWPQ